MKRWYVVQVQSGKEQAVVSAMRQLLDSDVLESCFTPRYQTQMKVRGRYRTVERNLIPGYVIAVARDGQKLNDQLGRLRDFTKLLRNEKKFTPLDRDEVTWMRAYVHTNRHVVPLSTAVKEGDQILVVDGPLKQHEFKIKRIDRRRSTAYVEVRFMGRAKEIPLGLKVLAKRTSTTE